MPVPVKIIGLILAIAILIVGSIRLYKGIKSPTPIAWWEPWTILVGAVVALALMS